MLETRHYEATDSHGQVHKRSTTRWDRSYTHAVVRRGVMTYEGSEGLPFVRAEFASDFGRAQQSAALHRSKPHISSVEVVETRLVKVTGRKQEAA